MRDRDDNVGLVCAVVTLFVCVTLLAYLSGRADASLAADLERQRARLEAALAHERARIDLLQLEVFGDDAAPREGVVLWGGRMR